MIMRYVIIAILIYLTYIVLRTVVRNISSRKQNDGGDKKSKQYDLNRIQDAEFKEVKKDQP
jgi:hypothetical protein